MKDHYDFDLGHCGSCLHYLLDEHKCDFHHSLFHPNKQACGNYLAPPRKASAEDRYPEGDLDTLRRRYCNSCPYFDSPDWCVRHRDLADPVRFRCF